MEPKPSLPQDIIVDDSAEVLDFVEKLYKEQVKPFYENQNLESSTILQPISSHSVTASGNNSHLSCDIKTVNNVNDRDSKLSHTTETINDISQEQKNITNSTEDLTLRGRYSKRYEDKGLNEMRPYLSGVSDGYLRIMTCKARKVNKLFGYEYDLVILKKINDIRWYMSKMGDNHSHVTSKSEASILKKYQKPRKPYQKLSLQVLAPLVSPISDDDKADEITSDDETNEDISDNDGSDDEDSDDDGKDAVDDNGANEDEDKINDINITFSDDDDDNAGYYYNLSSGKKTYKNSDHLVYAY
ncbi:hypothetical protein Glove_212g55 [Diversispora epigaea]|uniref:Uncharacterized protein n=1 Tax=Diversispora epigaea TaxID=1348612 RepID=A0A397ISR5_9GLOM|nr:hypothetical protein Glove_212g55 [Diversispora epigaea]